MQLKTIAWDVDDVLNDLMRSWLEKSWLVSDPICGLKYGDITENPPHKLLGVSLEEYLISLDGFRSSEAGSQLEPRPEIVDWFQQYGCHFRHVALTAAPLTCAHLSASWVVRHFGRWIRSFNFVPSPRLDEQVPQYDGDKAGFLRWWGRVDVLVDDNPINVEAARSLGIRAILAPRPWNRGAEPIMEALQALVEESL